MRTLRLAMTAAVMVGVTALFVPQARAQTIEVTTLADTADRPFDEVDPDPSALACGTGMMADLPGADGMVSLREAIIAANNTAGPQRIIFAPTLRGGTIELTFDNQDPDDDPDPLAFLCAGATTIDGDIDEDNVPDITLDGSAIPMALDGIDDGLLLISSDNTVNGLALEHFPSGGIGVVHISAYPVQLVANNTISHNVVRDTVASIFVNAGLTVGLGQRLPGLVTDTNIVGNTVVDAGSCGICLLAGDARTSLIERTVVADNTVISGNQTGIVVQANFPDGGAGATISNTTISGNTVAENGGTGIVVFTFAGRDNRITGLEVNRNTVRDNAFIGISLIGGVCGAAGNTVEAMVEENTLLRNGPASGASGIFAGGGGNFSCAGVPPPAADNHLDVTIARNTVMDSLGSAVSLLGGGNGASGNGITAMVSDQSIARSGGVAVSVVGGLGGPTTRADQNTVAADLLRTTVAEQASGAVNVIGALSAADENQVTTTIADSNLSGDDFGIVLTGGITADDRTPNRNLVAATIERNGICDSGAAAALCGNEPFSNAVEVSPVDAAGNGVTAAVAHNRLSGLLIGAGCALQRTRNQRCDCPGDCDANGEVRIDELVTGVNVALERRPLSVCPAADANVSGTVGIDDLVRTVNAIRDGCTNNEVAQSHAAPNAPL